MNGPDAPPENVSAVSGSVSGTRALGHRLRQNTLRNFSQWISFIAAPPPRRVLRPTLPAIAAAVAGIYVIAMSMFFVDAAGTAWARDLPQGMRDAFEHITNFGLSGWFLFPFGFVLLALAALISPKLSRVTQGVLTALAVRFGFLFLAIGLPGLFATIVKRLIGRARPFVGGVDDPFAYVPFIWRPEYAAMPSGHSTTAVAAAIAIGAIWPRSRGIMWVYALTIMLSRVIVLAHHPSDVIAGGLVGAAGALMMRRGFAARRLLFCRRDLRAFPGPSWRRISGAVRQSLVAVTASV